MNRTLTILSLAASSFAGIGEGRAQQVGTVPLAERRVESSPDAQRGTLEYFRAEPLAEEPVVTGVPFSAEAVTEFTQLLPDGNRIERRYTTSIWRDGQGRVRHEQQVALVGPLATHGDPAWAVTIDDPVTKTMYRLNKDGTASRGTRVMRHVVSSPDGRLTNVGTDRDGNVVTVETIAGRAFDTRVTTESLGTRSFDGILAQGTRTTMTIPAGEIGNVAPIDVVTERWFSPELQTVVMLSRRDPRSGTRSIG